MMGCERVNADFYGQNDVISEKKPELYVKRKFFDLSWSKIMLT